MWFFVSDQWRNTYIACHLPVVPIHILRTFALADNGSGVPIEPGGVWCEVQRIGRALSRYIYQVTNLWFGNHTTQYSHGLFYGPTQHPPKMMPTSYTSQIVESGTLRSLCSQLQSAFVRQSCPSFSRQLQISLQWYLHWSTLIKSKIQRKYLWISFIEYWPVPVVVLPASMVPVGELWSGFSYLEVQPVSIFWFGQE